ncbi:MAG TPA: HAMP domain-containing sensor histidine kinase [Pseudonocardiaceae bacterium]|nr:HAMP domain-containing sensor histidine kinase [Pseudonocardiaceae bacterium]
MSRIRRFFRPEPDAPDAGMVRQAALRIGAQAALTVAAIVLLLAGVAVLVVLDAQNHDAMNLLQDTVNRSDAVDEAPSDVWMTIQRGSRRAITTGAPDWLPDQPALNRVAASSDPTYVDIETLHTHGHAYLVRTQRRPGELVQVALDLHGDSEERNHLLIALIASGALGLVLAAATGAWLGRRAVAPLSTALGLQRRFVADAGHELRTPLTLLSTRAQLIRRDLRRGNDPDRIQSDVDSLVTDAKHLAAIIEDLLLAADPRGEARTEPVDLALLADQVVTASRPVASGVRLVHPGGPPVSVRGVPTALRRALTALLDNALRHARTEVTVTVAGHGREATVEVRDDGAGIDPELLPRVFDRFASTGTSTGGNRRYGLGLALVSEIAARHGGRVHASNGEHGGAVLRLILPLLADSSPSSAEEELHDVAPEGDHDDQHREAQRGQDL